ncbi:hypothetical protein SAMN06265795_104113 [Noviherbaspirillum humi]|uniref:Uncharacterized protein n=1 Tax=Noviherbaspirillum humi TaxID=1688639 RepID=A0A239FX69_9BURK|nr:hypothetical protein [Noviherbaspirillum humi]SNS60813.1 hypothetical protein SAMN06265795_104113 [Noviherbaspirillum humi]
MANIVIQSGVANSSNISGTEIFPKVALGINNAILVKEPLIAQAAIRLQSTTDSLFGSGAVGTGGVYTAFHVLSAFLGIQSLSLAEQYKRLKKLQSEGKITVLSKIFINTGHDGKPLIDCAVLVDSDYSDMYAEKIYLESSPVRKLLGTKAPPANLLAMTDAERIKYFQRLVFDGNTFKSNDRKKHVELGDSGTPVIDPRDGNSVFTVVSTTLAGDAVLLPNGTGPENNYLLYWQPADNTFFWEVIKPYPPAASANQRTQQGRGRKK